MIPARTYEVESSYALGLAPSDTVIEWALDAVTAGYDSPSLRILAGLGPPFDELEVKRLCSSAYVELSITPLAPQQYLKCYIASVLQDMLDGKLSREDAMSRLAGLFCTGQVGRIPCGDYELAYNFYLLFHQKNDFNRPGGFDFYWKGATKANIDGIIDSEAKKWLEAHSEAEQV